jgi:hypothetical protein
MAGDPIAAPARVIVDRIDQARFPWLFTAPPPKPTSEERAYAIGTTASLVATQRAATVLRGMWARRQETAVAAILTGRRYTRVSRRRIDSFADLPAGLFCPESTVFGQRPDVPVGLRNGRFL